MDKEKTVRISFVFVFIAVKCGMDDILVMGKDQAELDQQLNQVLDRPARRGLWLNIKKCLFPQSSLQYLGQILDGQGVRKDLLKVNAIVDMAGPQHNADLIRFLGLVNHLMKFFPDLAEETNSYAPALTIQIHFYYRISMNLNNLN